MASVSVDDDVLHPAVAEHLASMYAAADLGLNFNVSRMFGDAEPGSRQASEPATVIRINSRHADRRSPPQQPPAIADTSGNTPAGQRVQPEPSAGELADLPAAFDWRAYVDYHPELAELLASERQTAEHYRQHGGRQGLLCRRLRVKLRCTGEDACCGWELMHVSPPSSYLQNTFLLHFRGCIDCASALITTLSMQDAPSKLFY